jgi:hypothetical protein
MATPEIDCRKKYRQWARKDLSLPLFYVLIPNPKNVVRLRCDDHIKQHLTDDDHVAKPQPQSMSVGRARERRKYCRPLCRRRPHDESLRRTIIITIALSTTIIIILLLKANHHHHALHSQQPPVHNSTVHHRLHLHWHPLGMGILRLPTHRCHSGPHIAHARIQCSISTHCILSH